MLEPLTPRRLFRRADETVAAEPRRRGKTFSRRSGTRWIRYFSHRKARYIRALKAAPAKRTVPPATPSPDTARATFGDLVSLAKPRLSALSVVTALAGYLAATPERNPLRLVCLVAGTSLAAASAGALNQMLERATDARMRRTRLRPVARGAIRPALAALLGCTLALGGVVLLLAGTTPLAALLTALTLFSYLLVYTPLKTVTPYCTFVGALPGALPPLIGWAAATGSVSGLGVVLFALLLTWQIPHFMAIAWTHRGDYFAAGLPMFTVLQPSGRTAATFAVGFSWAFLGFSLLPAFIGQASWAQALLALPGAIWLIVRALQFEDAVTLDEMPPDNAARRLFLASIAVLPFQLAILVTDRCLSL